MYLKRIEIYGFKSFAQKTVLDFDYKKDGNITAVVGPNGSGKSNVADAIRWVTGEQSSKNLRSKKSEDVIFCGSAARPRGSYAEVTIVLSSEKPVKFELNGKEHELTEIEVARKYYRSGDSEYLINQRKVRLTDIQQLLASLGFGQSSYTVIGQGMVDRLLFFTASERKVLFDEAAGVKQYEIKREQSLRKLESTDSNLIRLKDILAELEPRVANLRRLVKRAEGRKELEAEIKAVQIRYFGALHAEYSDIVNEAEKRKKELNTKIVQIDHRIEKISLAMASDEQNPHSEERHTLEKEIIHQGETRDKLREELAFIKGQIESARANESRLQIRGGELRSELDLLKAELTQKKVTAVAEQKEQKDINAEIASENAKLLEIEANIHKLDTELTSPSSGTDSEMLTKLTSQKASLESKKEELSGQIYSLKQMESLRAVRAEQQKRQKEQLRSDLLAVTEKKAGIEATISDLSEQLAANQKDTKSKQKKAEAVSSELRTTEVALSKLAAQVTDQNLEEFTAELALVSDSHTGITAKLLATKSMAELAKIKAEYRDFSTNLSKVFARFGVVAKAVSVKERHTIEMKLADIRGRSEALASELSELLYLGMKLASEVSANQERLKDVTDRINAINKEISAAHKLEDGELPAEEIVKLNVELSKVNTSLSEVDSEVKRYSSVAAERQNAILIQKAEGQSKYNEQRQILHNLEMKASRKTNELGALTTEIAKNEARIVSIGAELADLDKGGNIGTVNVSELTAKEKQLSKIEEDIAKLRGGLTVVVAKEREFEQRNFSLEREKHQLETERNTINAQLSTLEVDVAKATVRLEDTNEEIKTYDINLDKGVNYDVLDQMEKDVLKLKLENIRRKLETTAGVDPETEAEYHELETRATEMSTQVEDLTKAKDDLTKVVRELDERIKNQFSDVFKNIATEFNRYFTMLFGGGSAKLDLGEDEEGNFGIEISANPPGKRVQTLTALSGGERTLTSLALLFAILSVNPSPFVVFDEVDAALDESNTVRFIKILEDLAKKTQFIIISHNRDTMKSASSLYGVTMDESHISKLLSVKLTEALTVAKS